MSQILDKGKSVESVANTKKRDNVIEDEGENENIQVVTRKRKLTSKVWEDFNREIFGSSVFATCKHCNSKFSAEPRKGTSHLNYHIKTCVKLKLNKRSTVDVSQMLLNTNSHVNETSKGVTNYKFDQKVIRESLARMIILHEYPFSIVQHAGFREYSNNLNPQFKMVSRVSIKDTCMQLYETEKAKLYESLESVSSKISITCDLWTSGQTKGYMSLTAHYIDADWKMQKRLLNFSYIPSPHTGLNIADKIYDKLLEWNIDSKLSSIVLDNCTTNDVVVRELQTKLTSRGLLLLNGALFHVRCCAHILNLIVQDGLGEITHVIESVRNCVKYVKSSTGRKEKFEEVVNQVRLAQQQVILDVPTRWNSTYLMLSRALLLKNAFTRMATRDKSFPLTMIEKDWENVELVCKCLKIFYDTTLSFSSTSRPTISYLFPQVTNIWVNLKRWARSDKLFMASMAEKMLSKFQKYWGTTSKLLAIASAIDHRYKMELISFCYPNIYGDQSELYINEVKMTLEDLHKDYCLQHEASSFGVDISVDDSSDLEQSDYSVLGNFKEYLFSKTPPRVKSDLERYLEEESIHVSLHDSVDILEWWKTNHFKYPIVSCMARDILSIPVTSVASESAFSIGGRVIDQYRSSLKPKTIEALFCTQYWLRCESKGSLDDDVLTALYTSTPFDDDGGNGDD